MDGDITEADRQLNIVVKKISELLYYTDEHRYKVDCIPKTYTKFNKDILRFSSDKTIKYLALQSNNIPQICSQVFNALDDFHVETQFLSSKQILKIMNDINKFNEIQTMYVNRIIQNVNYGLTNEMATNVMDQILKNETYEYVKSHSSKEGLIKLIRTPITTFIDIKILDTYILNEMKLVIAKEETIDERFYQDEFLEL